MAGPRLGQSLSGMGPLSGFNQMVSESALPLTPVTLTLSTSVVPFVRGGHHMGRLGLQCHTVGGGDLQIFEIAIPPFCPKTSKDN